MNAFWFELKQVVRGFGVRPAFVAVTVLTLALGIGANTAIFSAVDALLLRSLPFPEPDRLVRLWSDGTARGFARNDVVNPGAMKEWERSMTTVQSVAGVDFWDTTLTTDRGAVLVQGARVSWSYFETFGVPLLLGRGFTEAEDIENGPRVVVVTYDFWQRELGGDPAVLGRTIRLDGESWNVIGVLPAGFASPALPHAQIFKPLQSPFNISDGMWLTVLARLKPGVTIEQADADLDGAQARLAAEYPEHWHDLTGYVQPLQESLVEGVSRQLLVLLGATVFVLLIACANTANLLLARVIGRARELAVRSAVGASRMHIIRQVLIESTLLSLLGMALGMAVGWLGIRWIASALPPDLAEAVSLGVDWRVLGFALLISLATGLISGSVPAIIACRRDAGTALREGQRGSSGGPDGQFARAILVTGTFALALALTVSAGLFFKSLQRILAVDPGFLPDGLLTFSMQLPETKYSDPEALRNAQDVLLARLRAVPGVRGVGFTSTLPMGGLTTDAGTAIEGVPLEGEPYRTWYSKVSPGYLPALGVQLMLGRDIATGDEADSPCVAVANETYVQRYMGGESPIGKRVILSPKNQKIPCEIVGLVRDVHFSTLAEAPDPTLYLPAKRFPNRRFFVVMRVTGEPMAQLPAIREAVAEVDPGLALWTPAPMAELLRDSLRTPRLVTMLVGAFAAVALLLAASGVYGVATYNVSARMREFGVRTALGARRIDLLRQVLLGGLRLVAAGMAVGVLLTVAFGRVLEALLYEVRPFDVQVFGVVSLLLMLAAILAMVMPATRAARVHPMQALRYE